MKIIILNGSNRKHGATALILNELCQNLKRYSDVEIDFVNVADLNLKYCVGCCKCYETGKCIFNDDVETLSKSIGNADGIIIGSPTYASNVSGQIKVIIDRGHFVIEQLLHNKYAISVSTYENYGGKDTSNILNKLLSYSGAKISGTILAKTAFSTNPLENIRLKNKLNILSDKLYNDIRQNHNYLFQSIKHFLIFNIGILPFVKKKGKSYAGVIKRWGRKQI